WMPSSSTTIAFEPDVPWSRARIATVQPFFRLLTGRPRPAWLGEPVTRVWILVDYWATIVEHCGLQADFGAKKGSTVSLAQQRYRYITKALHSEGSVTTIELARALHVSTETVRRDLIQLERDGVLRRVYGGAVAPRRLRSAE